MSDTTAQELARALAPKGGMQRIPFPLESYQHASPPLSAKRLINLMSEAQPADARTAAALISTAGLALYAACGTGPILEMNDDLPGQLYVLSGPEFYRLYSASGTLTAQHLGTVGTATGGLRCSIAVGVPGVVVCVPPNAWTTTHTLTDPFNQLGGTFPGDASSVAYLDGYFVFTRVSQPSSFYISTLLDPLDYDALDFASIDAFSNAVRRVVVNGTDLWFCGANGIEVWYDAGAPDFPFRRQPAGIIQRTVATEKAIAVGDGSVFWLSSDYVVCRSNNYQTTRISTHAIEEILRSYDISAVASAVIYGQGGHILYSLNLSASGSLPPRTLSYDCATKTWHDRASSADGTGRWRVSAASTQAAALLGDYQTGNIYRPDLQLPTDNGVMVLRQATMPGVWAGTNRAFCSRVEIEMETGGSLSPGNVTLDWSDDGGHTWKGPRVMSAGPATEYRRRVFTTRLGSFRARIFRFGVNGHATFYAVDADIVKGAN